MNQAQRIVLVIALGLALGIVAITANIVIGDPLEPGWYEYSPNVGVNVSDDYYVVATDEAILRQALVWLAGLALWTAASLRLLRTRRGPES